jgi:hypothetical protein
MAACYAAMTFLSLECLHVRKSFHEHVLERGEAVCLALVLAAGSAVAS